jgi:hypothetical protein
MFTINRKNEIKLTQGDTAFLDITITNYDPVEGDILYFTVKKDITSMENTIQKKITEFDSNVAKVVLNTLDTSIDIDTYIYDIQLSLADGRVNTVILPTAFEIIPGVTHD